jgi:hypothetical protein
VFPEGSNPLLPDPVPEDKQGHAAALSNDIIIRKEGEAGVVKDESAPGSADVLLSAGLMDGLAGLGQEQLAELLAAALKKEAESLADVPGGESAVNKRKGSSLGQEVQHEKKVLTEQLGMLRQGLNPYKVEAGHSSSIKAEAAKGTVDGVNGNIPSSSLDAPNCEVVHRLAGGKRPADSPLEVQQEGGHTLHVPSRMGKRAHVSSSDRTHQLCSPNEGSGSGDDVTAEVRCREQQVRWHVVIQYWLINSINYDWGGRT